MKPVRLALVLGLIAVAAACSDDEPANLGSGGSGGAGGTSASGGSGGSSGAAGSPLGGAAGTGGSGAAGTGGNAGSDASADAPSDASDASDDSSLDAPSDAASDAPSDAEQYDAYPVDGSACGAVEQNWPLRTPTHEPVCSPLTFPSNPPCEGPHYPVWAAYTTYTNPVPPGFWVHDLEHGGVVLLYNCPSGCASEVAAAQAFIDGLPVDPICPESGGPARRLLLMPDPSLDVKWAAAAWGWTLKESCFEASVFGAFVASHYAHGGEDTCFDGTYIGPGIDGGFDPPAGCGVGDGGVPDAASD